MNTHLISIGNELLIGDTINTNASWMGQFLSELGVEVTMVRTLGDDKATIMQSIRESLEQAELVITTGGLGPTHDDITKTAVAELFGVGMRKVQEVEDHIRTQFRIRNIPFSSSNAAQALVPENAEILFNEAGTAPGMWFEHNNYYLAVLPGVPSEMKYLMKKRVASKLREVSPEVGYTHTIYLKTAGIGESTLSDEVIGDLSGFLNGSLSMAYLPSPGQVTLRITGKGDDRDTAVEQTRRVEEHIREKAGNYLFGSGKELTLAEALGEMLREQKKTLAVAESCTGGRIADRLTDIPGSSDYFLGGIAAYANETKIGQLGVDSQLIKLHGAVSKEVALSMAKGVAERLNADVGISTTGIAGPGGGTEEKPVGTVWIGYYDSRHHFALKAIFTKNREANKERSTITALEMTRRTLLGIDEMPYALKRRLP